MRLDNNTIKSNQMFNISDFKYLIPKSKCSLNDSAAYLITLVASTPAKFDKRAAIRETYGHSDPRIITYFLMGTVQSKSLQKRIDEEESHHHDIIQGNFFDSYHNLTYKHTMALKWFTENCPNVKYMLKIDDDVFANYPAVHDYLVNNQKKTKLLVGPYRQSDIVHRDGKWKTSREDYIDEYFPEYVEGTAIIYSSDFVKDAYGKTFTTPFFWIDDVLITGLIRMQLNVKIEPIESMLLAGDELSAVLNGTSTGDINSKFLFSSQSLKAQDIRKLWEYTEPIRTMQQLGGEN